MTVGLTMEHSDIAHLRQGQNLTGKVFMGHCCWRPLP